MFIGKSGKGIVVHAITMKQGKDISNHASCEARQKNLVVDDKLKPSNITCKRCLLRVDVKEAIANEKESKPKAPAKEMPSGIPAMEPSKKKVSAKAKTTTSKKKTTTTTTTKEVEKESEKVPGGINDGDWQMRPDKKGSFSVVHTPSGKVFFNGIPESIALDALILLAAIKVRWLSLNKKMPKDFVSKCRTALRDAYSQNNKIAPKYLLESKAEKAGKKVAPEQKTEKFELGDRITSVIDGKEIEMEYNGKTFVALKPPLVAPEEEEVVEKKPKRVIKRRPGKKAKVEAKPKRTIKRRDKKVSKEQVKESKRVIKRRSKEGTLLGRTKGTPGYAVLEMLQDGATMAELVGVLHKKHGLSVRKAWTKIRAVIRKTARKQKVPVVIVMQDGDAGNDYYAIETGDGVDSGM